MSIVVASSLKCTAPNTAGKITNSLNKFLNGASGALGDAYDMVAGLDTAVSEISDAMSVMTTGLSTLLEEKLVSFVDTGLQAAKNFIMNKITSFIGGRAQTNAFINAATAPINGLFKAFGCLGSVIKGALKGTIKNLLLNMLKKGILNPVECAVNDFISALTTKISNMMDGIITPLIAPIEKLFSIVGGAFGSVKGFLAGGLNILGKIQGLLNCKDGGGKCHVVETYDLKGQVKPKTSEAKKQNRIAKIFTGVAKGIQSANEGIDNLTKDVGNWGLFAGRNKVTKEMELKRVNKELSDIESEIAKIQEEIDSKESEIVKLNETTTVDEKLKDDIDRIKNRLTSLTVTNESLQSQIDRMLEENPARDDEQIKMRKHQLEENKKEIEDLKEELNRKESEWESQDVEEKTESVLQSQVDRSDQIVPLRKEIIELQGQINKLNGNIKNSNNEITELNKLEDGGIIRDADGNPLLNENEFTKELLAGEPDCDTGNIFDCGLPKVKFFGGGGEGAVGELILGNFIEELDKQVKPAEYVKKKTGEYVQVGGGIIEDVKKTASIIGVDITYPGEGYTSEPFVRFEDNCDKGFGAYGSATIDKNPNSPTYGQVTGVLMVSEGLNYPAGEPEDAFVEKIEVENGGSGYSLEDKIEDFEICGVDENGSITKVCTNDKAYRTLPSANVESITGSGAILTPVMTRKRRQTGVITVIDCITPKGNIVGYVNGRPYNGPFHVHPETGQKMVGLAHTTSPHSTIYNTPQESLRGGVPSSNVGSTKIKLRTIRELVRENETQTTQTQDTTYSDPVDESQNNTPPPSPPSSPPPSSPPPSSGSSGGGYGY